MVVGSIFYSRAGGGCYQVYGASGDKISITILGPNWRLVITKQQYNIKIVKNILYKNMILLNNKTNYKGEYNKYWIFSFN